MPTQTQLALGNITLPPTPQRGSTTLTSYQVAVEVWTRQCESAFRQMERAWTNVTTAQIPSSPSGLYFTDALARAALSAELPIVYDSITGVFSLPRIDGGNASTNS